MRWIVAACAVLVGSTTTAQGDPLDDARHFVEASDYFNARPALASALDTGTNGPDELAEIYKMSGTVEAALGNTAAAKDAFAKWLALEPKGTLPPGTSPKITRPFDAARKKAAKLDLKVETSATPPSVTLVIASDPIGIVRARVRVSADHRKEQSIDEHRAKDRVEIALPSGKRLDLRAEALDEHGNRVALLGSRDVPIVIVGAGGETVEEPAPKIVEKPPTKPVAPRPEPASPRAWYASYKVWAIATGVALAGTAVFAFETNSDVQQLNKLNSTSIDHMWPQAQAVESRAHADILATDIAGGLTGALALGTAILFLTRPHPGELRLSAAPAHGGGAFVVGGRF